MPTDSLSIGAAGMDAYQADIDVISNNIANVGTTAFKGQSVNFQDLLYQTQQPASGPTNTSGGTDPQEIGIGVKIGSTDTDLSQGGVQTTGINTNMMINGDGYFMLQNANGSGAPSYTRNGDFSLNANGMLYDPSNGLAVMGYSAVNGVVPTSGSPAAIQIPIGLKSVAIGTGMGEKLGPTGDKVFDLQLGGQLDSTQYAAAVSNGGVTSGNMATLGVTLYDSLGTAHQMNITFSPALNTNGAYTTMPFQVDNSAGAAVTAATEWAYTVTSTDGTKFSNGTTTSNTQYAFFDQSGNFINTSGSIGPAAGSDLLASTQVHSIDSLPSAADGNQLTISQWGGVAGSNNSVTNTVTPGPIGIDFSDVVANADPNALMTLGQQNGVAPGILSNVSVGQDGTITGSFTNGQSTALGRVVVAAFQNDQGLQLTGGSNYVATPSSGVVQLGIAGDGRFGSILGDSLEMSNVSIADQFTKLITAQNAFAANSKSISTASTDLQTVIGLIQG
jgi:flagellar hook protein FlgE